ncbi:hypothetical protein SAMN05421730_106911 [Anaerobium acetethylicum]|uniref:Uncharacterized protein n=1 Tax=Anaerobium acetethylicum TaxID=1619234 RepID=A0A1D3TZC9_9FIRM|nr:hypothetical protein SAMN05421730_106911 [Anaerobium acetethylicum]
MVTYVYYLGVLLNVCKFIFYILAIICLIKYLRNKK